MSFVVVLAFCSISQAYSCDVAVDKQQYEQESICRQEAKALDEDMQKQLGIIANQKGIDPPYRTKAVCVTDKQIAKLAEMIQALNKIKAWVNRPLPKPYDEFRDPELPK